MNSLAVKDVDNEVLADADAYLRKHKICELFEVSLQTLIAFQKWTNPSFFPTHFSFFFESLFSNRVLFEFGVCVIGLDNFALLQAARQRGVILGYSN